LTHPSQSADDKRMNGMNDTEERVVLELNHCDQSGDDKPSNDTEERVVLESNHCVDIHSLPVVSSSFNESLTCSGFCCHWLSH
jgi:hypothetical protein